MLRVIACPGAPACSSAWGETRALARRLSARLAPDRTLHVSGCSKGCASSEPADITIVHAADGCKLGFGLDVTQTSLAPADSIEATDRALTTSIAR
jgi:sulfite reductase beta subunit-like hemoprotein